MRQNATLSEKRYRRGKHWLFAFIVLCLLTIAAVRLWPRERLLMQLSRRIVSLVGHGQAGLEDSAKTFWLSNNRCLLVAEIEAPYTFVTYRWQVEEINAQSGQTVPVEGLNRDAKQYGGIPHLTRSPDGKWLNWLRPTASMGGYAHIVTAHIEGRIQHETDTEGLTSGPYWLNNTQWCVNESHYDSNDNKQQKWKVYDVAHWGKPRVVPENSLAGRQIQTQIEARYPPDFSITRMNDDIPIDPNGVIEKPPGHPTLRSSRVRHFDLPPDTTITECVPSPSGRQLAFFANQVYIEPLSAFLHHFFPRHSTRRQYRQILWVSDLRDDSLRAIGYVTVEGKFNAEPRELQWLPDEKLLSFIHQRTLWTVPVE